MSPSASLDRLGYWRLYRIEQVCWREGWFKAQNVSQLKVLVQRNRLKSRSQRERLRQAGPHFPWRLGTIFRIPLEGRRGPNLEAQHFHAYLLSTSFLPHGAGAAQ
jgi:hypothetical protein